MKTVFSEKLNRLRKYTNHLPRLEDKIKVIVAFIVVVGIPNKYERTRDMMRKILGGWIRKREMIVDDCSYKLADLDSAYIVNPAYEDDIKDYLNPKEGETLIDIGANIGKYVIYFAKKGVKVIAVEPYPDFFNILQKNVQINNVENRVQALNVAASDREAEVYLNRNVFQFPNIVNKPYRTNMVPLDKVVNEKRIDWIKIDVDGGEFEVLKGLKRVLETNRVKVIAELRPYTKDNVLSFLNELGYVSKPIFEYGMPGGEQLYYYFEKHN